MSLKHSRFREYQRKIPKRMIEILVMASLVMGIYAYQTRGLLQDDGTVVIPAFQLESLTGSSPLVMSAGQPQFTLVYFFAPWCSICHFSIGSLDMLQADSVNVVRVALDYSSREEITQFIDDTDVTGNVYLGDHHIKSQFNVYGYPTYYLLDHDLRVVASDMGVTTPIGINLNTWLGLVKN